MTSDTEQQVDRAGAPKLATAPGDDPDVWRIVQGIADPSLSRAELEAAWAAGSLRWSRSDQRERCREVAPGIYMVDLFDVGGGPGERGGMSSKWLIYRPDPARRGRPR
jgi:hypothetical protein